MNASYFIELKNRAREAAGRQDAAMALKVCEELSDNDVFLGESMNLTPSEGVAKIRTRYESLCQKCGHKIAIGEPALWLKSKGCMHMECI